MIYFNQCETGDRRDIIMFTQRNVIREACGLIATIDNGWMGEAQQYNDADYYNDLMDTADVSFKRVLALIKNNEKNTIRSS